MKKVVVVQSAIIAVLLLLSGVLVIAQANGISLSSMQANAACGNWTTYKTGSPYCVDKGCGLFWLSDTEYQKAYLKQVCTTSSGTTNTNYDVQENRLGCC